MNWDALDAAKFTDEREAVGALLKDRPLTQAQRSDILADAADLVRQARASAQRQGVVESFLQEFSLDTREGLALMCLAEALLRTPDEETRDRLIAEKIGSADWASHLGQSDSLFVNASTWGLMLTGKLIDVDDEPRRDLKGWLTRLTQRVGEPVIRQAVAAAVRIMGEQFVLGRTIDAALVRAKKEDMLCSFDMLGEGARTAADAERYEHIYAAAIEAVGRAAGGAGPETGHGVSVKLSALCPRYEAVQERRVWEELYPRVLRLAVLAARYDLNFAIDAEEADRLVISLKLFERLARAPELADWQGLGIVVQAYQKRGRDVIARLSALAQATGRRIMVRLVKGAYWDSEIKWAQERGLSEYPVFTRKAASDLCFDVCAGKLLAAGARVYAQFASHNPRSVATVLELAGQRRDLEFQKLHGMGDALYGVLRESGPKDVAVRVYAPVGRHRDLLPYLVRRLLENGASASFIHQIADPAIQVEDIVAAPDALLLRPEPSPLPRPPELYPGRRNAMGFDLADRHLLERLASHARTCRLPPEPAPGDAGALLARATSWPAPVAERSAVLERAAAMLEARHADFIALVVREGGKTIADAVSELREAVDYCRYYAVQARAVFAEPLRLPGPTGERNSLTWAPRGVFACIAPWNFPLAIFLGQVAAALAAGNGVIAKPAEQTPRVAAEAVALLHQAGVPREVLQLAVGQGGKLGAALVADPRISGIAFTGSTETARAINRALAERPGPIVPLIAETGGINPMLVDSSALAEQVVSDVLASAFQSAGQRCSALRVLFLQDEAADRIIPMLAGAMAELAVGDPADPATDVGPVIDAEARATLVAAVTELRARGHVIAEAKVPTAVGNFVPPVAVEVGLDAMPTREVFGPVLPVIRYDAGRLDQVLAAIERTGYGLTLGMHSRIDRFARAVMARAGAGNLYLNRSMIGAVVGVQPFGGHGLSGTGPKAGGPNYLQRFAREVTVSVNTAAIGGDVQLVARPSTSRG